MFCFQNIQTSKGGTEEMKRTYGKLRERIKQMYGDLGEFARVAGISRSALSYKLTGKTKINTDDIELYCKLLHLSIGDIPEYFFYS
jgi:DNA-binding Xre family transcriptional regulator